MPPLNHSAIGHPGCLALSIVGVPCHPPSGGMTPCQNMLCDTLPKVVCHTTELWRTVLIRCGMCNALTPLLPYHTVPGHGHDSHTLHTSQTSAAFLSQLYPNPSLTKAKEPYRHVQKHDLQVCTLTNNLLNKEILRRRRKKGKLQSVVFCASCSLFIWPNKCGRQGMIGFQRGGGTGQ